MAAVQLTLIRTRFFFTLLLLLLGPGIAISQVRLCSWNIRDFGKSKSDSEIVYIAEKLRDFDVVAIMEVVAGPGGSQAVARLADELNRKGSGWDYSVSDPTTGNGHSSERYAYLWKTAKLKKMGPAYLEQEFHDVMEREPYISEFEYNAKRFVVCVFHAITKDKQPETEIKYLKFIETRFPLTNIVFCGDFNCVQEHSVFNPLKSRGYKPLLEDEKTTLKLQRKGSECLSSAFDNIFYNEAAITVISSGVVPIHSDFVDLAQARRISDHLPVYCEFILK